MIIFTKFHKDRTKIVDFLLLAKFWACLLFFLSPSKYWRNFIFPQEFAMVASEVLGLHRYSKKLNCNFWHRVCRPLGCAVAGMPGPGCRQVSITEWLGRPTTKKTYQLRFQKRCIQFLDKCENDMDGKTHIHSLPSHTCTTILVKKYF